MNLLFVCSKNRLRSSTGEAVFSDYEGIKAIAAGTNKDAATTVTGDLIEWADVIFVMEQSHKAKVTRQFRDLLKDKKLICLDIPDIYPLMDPKLIRIFKTKVAKHLGLNLAEMNLSR